VNKNKKKESYQKKKTYLKKEKKFFFFHRKIINPKHACFVICIRERVAWRGVPKWQEKHLAKSVPSREPFLPI